MIDEKALLNDLKKLVKLLEEDLRRRCEEDPESRSIIEREYQAAKTRGRTGLTESVFRDDFVTQVAVAWVLAGVFVRFLEDNGFLDHPVIAGPGERLRLAKDHQTLFFDRHPTLGERDYLLSVFREVAALPGMAGLFDERHNPLFLLGPTADGATEILKVFRRVDPATGALVQDFTDERKETRFLGDLYQDLSEAVRKKYALLQTPEFVEEFILDRTLDPAIEEFGLEEVTLIDPTCGSGHFLLGAFRRLLDRRQREAPSENVRHLAQQVLDQVFGVDINPYAAEIARFRLLIAALDASGVDRLKVAPDFQTNVVAGDSLLFGRRPRHKAGVQRLMGEDPIDYFFATEDSEAVKRVLERRYHVVVGNPPYITPKDPVLSKAYRDRFPSCYKQYSLVIPFVERFFDLAVFASKRFGASGFVGLIVANTFAKRDFGKRLIEEFLPRWDVVDIVDTSWVEIPAHETPTLILFARCRPPGRTRLRAVLGIRGEEQSPANAAEGAVWKSIVELIDNPGSKSEYVSVVDRERDSFSKHPWSLGGGHVPDVLFALESVGDLALKEICSAIGRTTVCGEDPIYIMGKRALERLFVGHLAVPLVIGENVRDWAIDGSVSVLYPYQSLGGKAVVDDSHIDRYCWRYRTVLMRRSVFGKTMRDRGQVWYEHLEHYKQKLRTPLSIAFAFVATHNHFVLDRGGKVFKQSAPVIKLPPEATEDDHLGLLGLLNSSTACFWMKQVFYPKATTTGDISSEKGKPEENRYEIAGTGLLKYPVPTRALDNRRSMLVRITRMLDSAASVLQQSLPRAIVLNWSAANGSLRELLKAGERQHSDTRARMIALQEELDWEVYRVYGLVDEGASVDVLESSHGIPTLARPFLWESDLAPEGVPVEWLGVYEKRRGLIGADLNLATLETLMFKRPWLGRQGVYGRLARDYEGWTQEALSEWLLDRIEKVLEDGTPGLISCARLADLVQGDADFHQVAELFEGRPDFDVSRLIAKLVLDEAVPFLPVLRYKPSGLERRKDWERTWDLQREEDAIDALGLPPEEACARKAREVGEIPVPRKYKSSDFQKATYWRLRGKLDVPKERFILYPHAEREVDGTPVVAWAGLNHLQQARALAAYYLERKENDGWERDRLQPLLVGLLELVPWLEQWHEDIDPEYGVGMGTYFAGFVHEEARALGLTTDDIREWGPPERKRKARRSVS